MSKISNKNTSNILEKNENTKSSDEENEFNFDTNSADEKVGIPVNVTLTEIFAMLWTEQVTNLIVHSWNGYERKLTGKNKII